MSSFFLPNIWMWSIVIVLALASIGVGVVRNLRFRREQNLHRKLARRLGLRMAFADTRDFTLFGTYREYPLRIEAVSLSSEKAKSHQMALKLSLPMVNPNLKALRIARRSPEYPLLDSTATVFKRLEVAHGIADWMEIETNDMLFAHYVLTDDIKMDLVVFMKPLEAVVVYIQDEELACLLPGKVNTYDLAHIQAAADLLCNIKEVLN
jgi:hypothetical protein